MNKCFCSIVYNIFKNIARCTYCLYCTYWVIAPIQAHSAHFCSEYWNDLVSRCTHNQLMAEEFQNFFVPSLPFWVVQAADAHATGAPAPGPAEPAVGLAGQGPSHGVLLGAVTVTVTLAIQLQSTFDRCKQLVKAATNSSPRHESIRLPRPSPSSMLSSDPTSRLC